MRLVVFTTQFPPAVGGVETMSWQLSKHLQDRGEDVCVLTNQIPGADAFDRGQSLQIKRYELDDPVTMIAKGKQKFALIETLRTAVNDWQADGVLCTGWDPCAYIASIALAKPRVPYFLIAHGMELMQLPRKFPARQTKALMRRKALFGAQTIFSVSSFTRDRLVELGVPPQKILVVPNGVTVAETQQHANGNGRRKIITTVSRLVPRKGHDTVLRAMPRVLEQVPDAVYRIVGKGPELPRLRALAQELKLNGSVEFHDKVDDHERDRLLNECNLFVLATRATATDFEGLGIAVLEAMEKGKPVVVTRAGGVPEIVENGETGFVVEPDEPDALADAMLKLLREPENAAAMGAKARSVIRNKYVWDVIAGRYQAELKNGINSHH